MSAVTTSPHIECSLQETPLDLLALRRDLPELPDCGGYVSFEGIVRNVNHGRKVLRLDYEAYDSLAEKELRRIAEQAAERFRLKFVRAVHRTGSLAIGDTAVVIQVLSRHRREAFEGCRFVIDQLKARVPVWKKEHYEGGDAVWTRCHDHDPDHTVGPLSLTES
jgi:molybdopterin synthase catalytic subunit